MTFEKGAAYVTIATHVLTEKETLAFAKADGFVDVADFSAFFLKMHGPAFDAYLVRWWPEDRPGG